MKLFIRTLVLLMLLPALAPMLGTVSSVSANTELTPASRLVVPFIDITSGRDTFLLLTNVSRFIRLDRTAFSVSTGSPAVTYANTLGLGVHLEFYDQVCDRNDTTVDLTPQDINQLDFLVKPNLTGVLKGASSSCAGTVPCTNTTTAGRGFIDIDVRVTPAQLTDPSVQMNTLMGEVVISDFASDFAFAYPAASSIGSSTTGVAGLIVTRTSGGAVPTSGSWTGRYEPFPPRVFVPAYFAEGTGTGAAAGQVFTTFLAIAAPANGNWFGQSGAGGVDEAPGQALPTGAATGAPVINASGLLFDGCEQQKSQPFTSHYVNNSLGAIFGTVNTDRANWSASNCTNKIFPGLDSYSGSPVGWVDITNAALAPAATTGGSAPRGVVGVFFENIVGGTPTLHLGDASRLWGDPSFIQTTNCAFSGGGTATCRYSLVDTVCHIDVAPTPSTFPTTAGNGCKK